MAKRRDTDLFNKLRASGLRKKVARVVTEASRKAQGGKQPKLLERTVRNLRTAAAELEHRMGGARRSEASKKAARTRKRKAAARSNAARKAAKTRARTGG
jgi:hypothetical protein